MNRSLLIAAILICVAAGEAGKKARFDFESGGAGALPAGFTTALTGGGGAVTWVIAADPRDGKPNKVLAQTSTDDTDNRFPLCVCDQVTAKDVTVGVHFKAVAGKVDQAAGLVVRYADKDNYYLTRANALEDNVRFYKVQRGSRKQLAGTNLKVTSGQWHTLRLTARGAHFQVYYDDKLVIEADDDTFKSAGFTGLWTKADSVTYFDDLEIESADAN